MNMIAFCQKYFCLAIMSSILPRRGGPDARAAALSLGSGEVCCWSQLSVDCAEEYISSRRRNTFMINTGYCLIQPMLVLPL
jgi:hypothetical protein